MQIRFLTACNGISLSIWRSTLKRLERTSLHFSRHPQAWFPRDVNHRRFRVSGLRGLINGVRLYDGDRLHRLIFARHNTDITNRKWSARNRVRVTCKCTSVTVITRARSNSERICKTCRLLISKGEISSLWNISAEISQRALEFFSLLLFLFYFCVLLVRLFTITAEILEISLISLAFAASLLMFLVSKHWLKLMEI